MLNSITAAELTEEQNFVFLYVQIQNAASTRDILQFLKTSHTQRSRFTAPATESEHAEDHHHVQNTEPSTKFARRGKTAPISCTCHEKSTLDHQNTRCSLCLPQKAITKPENLHGITTRARSRTAPVPAHQILRASVLDMNFEDL